MERGFAYRFRQYARSSDGAVVVEFSLVLPFMILIFVLFVEGASLLFSYQSVVSGVRDAGRYAARVVPGDYCTSGGTLPTGTKLKEIVEESIDGTRILNGNVTIASVTPSVTCHTGSYRNSPVAVATVTANMSMTFPMRGILDLFGGGLSTMSTTVTDQARVIGQ